nr:hypothetical protein [Tanacetum cinerariifolium]
FLIENTHQTIDIVADVNAPSGQAHTMASPLRTDEEIVPRNRWVQIGKSNFYLDLDKKQSNPIYKMAVDLLMDTNFYRAFTASSTIPSIYIQQFRETIQYDKKAGSHRCQLDEQWFVLTKYTLREALQITPINNNQAFVAPSSTDVLVDFVNELGYPKLVRNVSNVVTNDMFQPWRALTTIINLCLTRKTSGFERPRAPVLQILWGIKKQYKQATETSDKPPKAKKSKYGWVTAEDAELQKVLEESMKTAYAATPRGSLPPVVIRDPKSEKYQPLLEVPRKGKAKVFEEQVAHDLLSLKKPKKKSPADQYILQRYISEPAGSTLHEDSPYAVLGQSDSEEESKKVMLGATEGGNDEDQARPDPDAQAEGQTGTDAGTLDEGQARSNPDEMSEGQVGPDPGNAGDEEQSIPSPVVYTGSDREHMELDVADVSPQPSMKQLDEGFTATAYSKVQESLKLAVEEHVLLEELASSSGTLSSLQHLMNKDMEERLDKHGTRLYTLEQLHIPQQVRIAISEVVTDAVDWAMQAPLRNYFRDLPKAEIKEIVHQRMNSRKTWLKHARKRKKSREAPKTPPRSPPPPSPPAGPSGASGAPGASRSSQVPPPPPPPPSSTNQDMTPADLEMDEDMGPNEQAQLSNDEDVRSAYIPKTGDIATFIDWFCKRRGITELKPQDLEGPAFEIIKVFHPDVIHLQYRMEECHKLLTDSVDDLIIRKNVSKPLPLDGPPGQVRIQSDFFFNKDLEYLRYGSKGSRPAMSISKMKAAYYLDAG